MRLKASKVMVVKDLVITQKMNLPHIGKEFWVDIIIHGVIYFQLGLAFIANRKPMEASRRLGWIRMKHGGQIRIDVTPCSAIYDK
jgi:hypothetical protein